MNFVDLHVHSNFSDGSDSPEKLIELAKETGLSAMALTDHDTVSGVTRAVKASCCSGIELIPGVELSTFFDKIEVHIVGLFVDYKNPEFLSKLKDLQDVRTNRNIQMCEKCQENGFDITFAEMCEAYGDAVLTRAHFADIMLKKGYVKSRNEAFDRFLSPGCSCYVPRKKITPADGIKIIKDAGGIPILAHPVLYHLGKAAMTMLMDEVTKSGICGLEAIYSTYSPSDEREMRALAKKYDILISGGSDYHGTNKPNIKLGKGLGHLFVPEEVLDNIKKLR